MNKLLPFLIMSVILTSCGGEKIDKSDPQWIVDQVIAGSGGEHYARCDVEFDFRHIHYRGWRKDGMYSYERSFDDSLGKIHDILTNDSFERRLNGEVINVHDTMAVKYQRSVNSVLYFAFIPHPLNDPAVNKIFNGVKEIKGKNYLEVEVTFAQEGGGEDFEDVFVYWIDEDSYELDYFAYSYETDGGGMRFREALNPRVVNGMKFLDYINFKPASLDMKVSDLADLYIGGELEELSRIELRNIEVAHVTD